MTNPPRTCSNCRHLARVWPFTWQEHCPRLLSAIRGDEPQRIVINPDTFGCNLHEPKEASDGE